MPNKCAPKIRLPLALSSSLPAALVAFPSLYSTNTLNPEYLSPILRDEYQLKVLFLKFVLNCIVVWPHISLIDGQYMTDCHRQV